MGDLYRNNVFAREMWGPEAFSGVARFALRNEDHGMIKKKNVDRVLFAGMTVTAPGTILTPRSYDILDCEIFVLPIRREVFRGRTGLRIDQVLLDYHYSHAFGEGDETD